jgi:serine/threonine protein kinase
VDELQPNDPRSLGNYAIVGRLGSGGFGIVYLAVDQSGQQFAIKVLRSELADDQRLRVRLAREARAIAAVEGNRTAKVFEVVTDGPFAYLVMEYVQGASLQELVLQGRKPEGPLLWFTALGLVEALQEIHAAGITHRDLKPSNVIVGPDGVKVVDFGISAIADEAGFTQTGTLMGSAAWLSPEQVSGAATDQRTDIFNLGLTLAFLSTGKHPFGDGRPDAVMYRIIAQAPNLDSIASPLRIAIQRCLERSPEDRPSLEALDSFFSSGGSESSDISTGAYSRSDATFVVQPEAVSNAARATAPQSIAVSAPSIRARPNWFRSKIAVSSLLVCLLALGVIGALDATNTFDIGVIGKQGKTSTSPGTTLAPITATSAPSTTIKVARTTTTTEPPPPAFRLFEENGRKYRWNPCDGPIEILLNPATLSPNRVAALGTFIQKTALEIMEMTEIPIFYAGITDKKTSKSRLTGEEIIIQIDEPGNGVLENSGGFSQTWFGYGRTSGDFREINNYQIHIDINEMFSFFTPIGDLDPDGKWVIMNHLGQAMGLEWMNDQEVNAFGLTTKAQKQNEVMYWDDDAWYRSTTPTWGPGDKFGMFLVGTTSGCF